MFKKTKTKAGVVGIEVLEKEISQLQKENEDLKKQLIIANRYKDEYKGLCEDYKKKAKLLDKLIKDTKKLGEEKLQILDKM